MERSGEHVFTWSNPLADGEDNSPQFEQKLGTGVQLATARKNLGLTVSQLASRLKLSEEVIKSVEKSEFHKLHGRAYATGYVRAYAKEVDVDPESLINNDPDLGVIAVKDLPHYVYLTDGKSNRGHRVNLGKLITRGIILITLVTIISMAWLERDTLLQFWMNLSGDEPEIELLAPTPDKADGNNGSVLINRERLS